MGRSGLDRILEEGRTHYPYECCGFLVGRWADGKKQVLEVRPADNARADSPQNRDLIPPEILLRIEKEIRARDLEVVGFFHSHPDVEARPSAVDQEHAWPGFSFVNVSVRAGAARETRSWV